MNMKDVKNIAVPNPDKIILPSGYTQKTYISKIGEGRSGYIDLGITPTANTNIECTFEYSDASISTSNYSFIIFGAFYGQTINSSTTNFYLSLYRSLDSTESKSLTLGYGDTKKYAYDQFTSDTVYTFRNDGGNVYINNVLNANLSNNSPIFSNTMGKLMIGACGIKYNSSTGYTVGKASFKLYRFKVWESGVLIKDLIPVVQSSPYYIGLYDLINNEFIAPTVNFNSYGDTVGATKKVKKIEDSNGNIIWGSQDAFPYRRLEYIDMGGKFYNTNARPAKGFYFLDTKINKDTPINTSFGSYGAYLGSTGLYSSTFSRLQFFGNSNGVTQRIKTQADALMSSWSNLSNDTKYQFRLRTYFTNNTSGRWWFAFQNLDTDSQIYGQYYNNTTYAINLDNLPYMHINAYSYNSSGTSATPQSVLVKGALNFKLFRYYIREDSDTSDIISDCYPCQRKSDNAVGLYNVKTNTFLVIQNASDNSTVTTRTEPIADEYWDLTAPS